MLACLHCGRELSPRAVACPQCGEPGPAAPPSGRVAPPPAPPAAPSPDWGGVSSVMTAVNRTDPYAIASIVCAVANFVGAFFVGAVLAVVFGKMAEKRIAANPALEGASLARTGIIIGWVGLGFGALMLLFGITALGLFAHAGGAPIPVHFTN